MYVNHFKAYQDFFSEVVERMEQEESKWEQARILNMIELALMTRDEQWFKKLMEELNHGI